MAAKVRDKSSSNRTGVNLDAGLRAVIAIHNTTLGPALGE
jgi:hypothetical protein